MKIEKFFSNQPLLKVVTEEDYIHEAFKYGEGVISYEHIPYNSPSGAINVWATIEEYMEEIKSCDWVNNIQFAIEASDEIYKKGYPFEVTENN